MDVLEWLDRAFTVVILTRCLFLVYVTAIGTPKKIREEIETFKRKQVVNSGDVRRAYRVVEAEKDNLNTSILADVLVLLVGIFELILLAKAGQTEGLLVPMLVMLLSMQTLIRNLELLKFRKLILIIYQMMERAKEIALEWDKVLTEIEKMQEKIKEEGDAGD